jgi:hypothetical protein
VADLREVRLQPQVEGQVVARHIADDDRPQLPFIPRAQEGRIEGDGAGQAGDVLAVDRAVAGELREREVVRVQREEREPREPVRPERGQRSSYRSGRLATVTCWRYSPWVRASALSGPASA